jgi:putative ABC transport system permease protein
VTTLAGLWLAGLIRHRGLRLLGTAAGIAIAVGLTASLGQFIAGSQASMTDRATRGVAVDWQVEVQRGADPSDVLKQLRSSPGTGAVQRVGFAATTGLQATAGGTTQTTGPGVVLGIDPSYRATFPAQIRTLTGHPSGVLLAQQTASNLHVVPGDRVSIGRPGRPPATVVVDAVVDLPQADSLFQRVGAPPQSQPSAPPDNVVLLPAATFTALFPDHAAVTTQFHVHRTTPLPPAPEAAYTTVTAAAHHLEAATAGAALVGDNLGAALGAAREDAAYAQILFLFLAVPGVVLAGLLTAAVVVAGAPRRRAEQSLLRTRGLSSRAMLALAAIETLLVSALGCLTGLGLALLTTRAILAPSLNQPPHQEATATWWWGALLLGVLVAAATTLVPVGRDLRSRTVAETSKAVGEHGRHRSPWWLRAGLDLILIGAAALVYRASSANNYTLVLAPEGVPTISVSYWAFLGPALLWLGAAGLFTRALLLGLSHADSPLASALRPLTGRLATAGAASLARQRPALAQASVLLALALSFAVSTATFNATYAQQAEADAQLTNGADVTVTEPPNSHVSTDAGTRLAAVPGVRHVEPLQHRFAYVGADLQDLYGVRPSTIRTVTALQDAYFSGGSAQGLLAHLEAHPDSILVSAETVKDFQLSPGDPLRLRLTGSPSQPAKVVTFRYVGVVNEFPTAPKDSFFVANADYVARMTGNPAVGAFLVDTGGTNQPQTAAAIRRQLGASATVTDLTQTRGNVGSSLTSVNLRGLTAIELAYAVALAVAAGALVLGLRLADRRRTLAIMAVLGARPAQLRGLVAGEAILITVAGLIGGALIGTTLSRMLVTVLTGVFDPPPSSIAVPWPYLGFTVLAVAAALLAAAALGARSSARPPIEELRAL